MTRTAGQQVSKVASHGATVMRDENPTLLRRKSEEIRIFRSAQTGGLDIKDIDCRLPGAKTVDDVRVEVFVRE
jgi:hypothetical protein